jgi:GNAT superfamily N-acetyltransferase
VSPILESLSEEGVREALEAQALEGTELWTRWGGGRLYRDPDMLRYVTDEPLFFANGVVCARLHPDQVDRRIEETAAFFEAEGVSWGFGVSPHSRPADLEAILVRHDFHLEEELPRMAAEIARIPMEGVVPRGFEVRRVEDDTVLSTWVDTLGEGFGMDGPRRAAMARVAAGAGVEPAGPWIRFLGILDGQPVATSGVFLAGGLAGLINVATIPEARRRGIGTVMTLAALQCGFDMGFRVAVLGTTEMGRRIYERMGFSPRLVEPVLRPVTTRLAVVQGHSLNHSWWSRTPAGPSPGPPDRALPERAPATASRGPREPGPSPSSPGRSPRGRTASLP